MRLPQVSLSKKILGTILGTCILSTVTLFVFQHVLYSENFDATMTHLEESVLEIKRESSEDILREVIRESTERIEEVTKVTQATSDSSQQMASSSEQLGARANALHDLVGHFKA